MCDTSNELSPETAAQNATNVNGGLAAGQLATAYVTENLGFVVEGAHNLADAGSFWLKKLAMKMTGELTEGKARAARGVAAVIFAGGGLVGVVGSVEHAVHDKTEDTGNLAVGVAALGAGANHWISRRTQRAIENRVETGNVRKVDHECADHAKYDKWSSYGYLAGLTLERWVTPVVTIGEKGMLGGWAANISVFAAGALATHGGSKALTGIIKEYRHGEPAHNHDHDHAHSHSSE